MKSKYMAVIPFLFAFGVLLISGCSVTTQKSTSSQENMLEIIIGSDDFPPFNYSDENGEPAGIDVDIANEALGRLGYKPVFTKIVWDDKDKDLENKDVYKRQVELCAYLCWQVSDILPSYFGQILQNIFCEDG